MTSETTASNTPGSINKRRSDLMGSEPIGKLLWQFSLPGVIAMLVNATYNIVDRIFVGGLGPSAIASLTVVFPLQMIIIAIGSGTGIGAASLVSRRLGEGRIDEANTTVGQTLGISIILGALIAIFGLLLGKPLLKLMGASEAIMSDSLAYLTIILGFSIFNFTNMTGNNLVRAGGHPIVPMVAMISGAAINIILDPIFIYTLKMGVKGAAIATVIAQVIVTLILFYYLFGNRTDFRVKLRHYIPRFKVWTEIYRIGGPHTLMSLVGSVAMAFVISIAAPFGDQVIAAYGILFSFFQLGFMPCIGISTGALPLIGYNYGAKNYLRVRSTIRRTFLASMAITTGISVIAITFPEALVKLFVLFQKDSSTQDVAGFVKLASHAMRIAFIGFPFVGPQIAFTSFFQGTGKGLPSAIIGISRQLLLLVPAVYILTTLFGQNGLWFALPISDTLAFIFSAIWATIAMCRMGIGLWGKCNKSKSTGK
ncbi:MATE family efflux transporter [bacterium]|nr:MATE family efflux transporter [bacterium]